MSTTVVVARAFRGSRLYLVSAKTLEFTWTANRDKALPLSVDVALRIIRECEDFARGTNAFAIDKNDCVIARASNGAVKRLEGATVMQTISEWLAECDSHSIYAADKLAADFKKCTGQDLPDYVRRFDGSTTVNAIKARGLGGEFNGADNDLTVWGYAMAQDFARQLVNYRSNKMGRGFIFRDCIEALQKGGY